MDRYKYIGAAIFAPTTLSAGKPVIATGLDVIEHSILDILNTPQGSRLFLPEYGSRLHELLFEPNDLVLKSLLRQFIREALTAWEQRIQFKDVKYKFEESVIYCEILYSVLPTNEIKSFIYPYYSEIVH